MKQKFYSCLGVMFIGSCLCAVEVGVDLFGYKIVGVKADCNPFGPSCYTYAPAAPIYVAPQPVTVTRPVYYNPPPSCSASRSIESRNIHIENSPNAKVIINEQRSSVTATTPTYAPQPTRVIYVPSNGVIYNNGYVPYPPPAPVYYYSRPLPPPPPPRYYYRRW